MKVKGLFKRMFSILCLFSIILTSSVIYADTQINNEVEEVEKVNLKEIEIYLNGKDKVEIDMDQLDNEGKEKVKEYISEIGMEEFERKVKEEFKIKEEKEILISDPEENIALFALGGSYYKESETYKLVTFEKGFTVEYIAVVGITVNIFGNKITNVQRTSFDVKGMSAAGSYGNVRMSSYVASNKDNAGATANYDVYFSYSIGDFIPIKYTKNAVDYVVAHVSDFM